MERMLRVYVYKEGGKPIFHTPILKGLYASEGWFMRLMEGNKHFRVKDPQKAHLFYMPFSSRFLQFALYVPGSRNRKNLAEHLKNYVDKIASKYPFWNRTGGTDHFLVACHDWVFFFCIFFPYIFESWFSKGFSRHGTPVLALFQDSCMGEENQIS